MVYTIQQILGGQSKPVCVTRETSVIEALDLMIEHDYSQLPVIDQASRPVGIITYESTLKGIRNFKASLGELFVRNVMIKPAIAYEEENLFDLLDQLKQTNAVLIEDNNSVLVGIVTSYDSTEYFRDRYEDMMRVQDIEATIKELILSAYSGIDDSLDKARLNNGIKEITKNKSTDQRDDVSIDFEKLTLGDYINLLLHGTTWKFAEPILKMKRESVRALLDSVRETRNDLAHFRRELSAFQFDQLRYCSEWLAQSLEEFREQEAQKLFDREISVNEMSQVSHELKEQKAPYQANSNDKGAETIIPEEKRSKDSRYGPLADFLQGQPGDIDQLTLTFDEIEKIINGPLPSSARTHRAWWSNDAQVHPHSQLWLEVGWRTTFLNMSVQRVTFARIQEREKAYIEFFSRLLENLRQEADFPVKNINPDGSNWVICKALSTASSERTIFVYSFARGKRFRVEFYIDTSVWETTKQIFDKIYAQRSILEAELGEISWERIDDKRGSRVALYHPGAITDSENNLTTLRAWAVKTMIEFYKKLQPVASKAIEEVLGW